MSLNSLVVLTLLVATVSSAALKSSHHSNSIAEADCPRQQKIINANSKEAQWFLPSGSTQIAPLLFDAGECPLGCVPTKWEDLQIFAVSADKRILVETVPNIVIIECSIQE